MRTLAVVAGLALLGGVLAAQSPPARPGYDVAFIGPPLADPVMQHAKETYVLFGCAYCHGVTLIPRGEAADLMHSALVGSDTDGTTIAALLRAGIPQTAKLSPMPQFSDLSDRQLADIARYIHFARQEGRYRELVAAPIAGGNAAAGQAYFDATCRPCHREGLSSSVRALDRSSLRERILRPPVLQRPVSYSLDDQTNTRLRDARDRHNWLLENYTASQLVDVIAHLKP